MTQANRPVGRPPGSVGLLSREAIGRASIEALCSPTGQPFTISHIARCLGVRSQSLYHHIDGLADAVNAARGVLVADMDLSVLDRELFEDAATGFALEYYRVFHPLSAALSTFFLHEVTDPNTLSMYELFLQRAIDSAVPGPRALSLLLDLEYTVFSMIFEQTGLESMFNIKHAQAETFPLLTSLLESHPTDPESARARLCARVEQLVRNSVTQD